MFNLSAHTTDDRGKRVPVFSARGQPAARFEADPALREIIERLAAAANLGLNERITRLHILTMGPFILTPILMIFLGTVLRFPPLLTGLVVGPVLLAVIPIGWAIMGRATAARTRATLLREGRCACCAYGLGGLPVEPDGRIACPECSAAWTAASVGAPSVSTPRGEQPAAILRGYTARASAIDALDRVIPLRNPMLRELEQRRADEIGRQRLASTRADVQARTRGRKLTGVLAWLLIWLFTGFAQGLLAFSGPTAPNAWPTAMAAFFTILCLVQIYRVLTYRSRSTALPAAKVLIEHQICPSCAGDLDTPPEGPILTCRDCRAAWRPTGP